MKSSPKFSGIRFLSKFSATTPRKTTAKTIELLPSPQFEGFVSISSFDKWERQLEASKIRIHQSSSPETLKIYSDMANQTTQFLLDPLQLVAFNYLASEVIDVVMADLPDESPISGFIENLTAIHVNAIAMLPMVLDAER